MYKNENNPFVGCLAVAILYLIIFLSIILPLSFWTDRNLDFWLTYFKGCDVDAPFWLSILITLFGNGLTFLLNIIGEIARLFVG